MQWQIQHDGVVAFHGTQSDALLAILTHGISCGNNRNFGDEFYDGGRNAAVFVTNDRFAAEQWARVAVANLNRGSDLEPTQRAVVLELRIPFEHWKSFQCDRTGCIAPGFRPQLAAYRTESIPPRWIVGHVNHRFGDDIEFIVNGNLRGTTLCLGSQSA